MNVIFNTIEDSSEVLTRTENVYDNDKNGSPSSSLSSIDFIKLYRGREGMGLFEPSLPRFSFIKNDVDDPRTKFTPISDVGTSAGERFDEAMEGLTMANSTVTFVQNDKILFRDEHAKSLLINKVKIISGGKGNWSEFVGKGMLTCAVMGTAGAPKPRVIFVAIRELSKSDQAGTIAIVPGNYEDELNWSVAVARAQQRGMKVSMIPVRDAACHPNTGAWWKNGLAGIVLYFKIGGAMSERNYPIENICERLRSLSVATISCLIDEGIRFHTGPEGCDGTTLVGSSGKEAVKEIIRLLIDPAEDSSLGYDPNSHFLLLVNAYSGNQYFLNSITLDAVTQLQQKNIPLLNVYSGFYLSSSYLGFSITLMAEVDDDIIRLLDDPTTSAKWTFPGNISISRTSPKFFSLSTKGDKLSEEVALSISLTLKAVFTQAALSKDILNGLDTKREYGTKFSSVALLVLNGLESKELNSSDPFQLFYGISEYFLNVFNDSDGIMYALLLTGFAQVFVSAQKERESNSENIKKKFWVSALKEGISLIKSYFLVDLNDGTILDVLWPICFILSASKFENLLAKGLDVAIEIALEKYKNVGEQCKQVTSSPQATVYSAYILASAFSDHMKLMLTMDNHSSDKENGDNTEDDTVEEDKGSFLRNFRQSFNETNPHKKSIFVVKDKKKSALESSNIIKRTAEKGDIFKE